MKNMFGVVPGAKYDWPKNILHWKGIERSILGICATVPVHFVIADGIIAMEGNGLLNGTPREVGQIILADDPVATDATCARANGLRPGQGSAYPSGAQFLGNSSLTGIDQLAEMVEVPETRFGVVPELEHMQLPCNGPSPMAEGRP